MSPEKIILGLRERGVAITATTAGDLKVNPGSALADADKAALRESKKEIIWWLVNEASQVSLWGEITYYKAKNSSDTSENTGVTNTPAGDTGDTSDEPDALTQQRLRAAGRLGLVARFHYTKGYTAIHDPTTGDWHEVPTKKAPEWAKNEAIKRIRLKKERNIHRMLNREELEEIWREDGRPEYRLASPRKGEGLVYRDYLEED